MQHRDRKQRESERDRERVYSLKHTRWPKSVVDHSVCAIFRHQRWKEKRQKPHPPRTKNQIFHGTKWRDVVVCGENLEILDKDSVWCFRFKEAANGQGLAPESGWRRKMVGREKEKNGLRKERKLINWNKNQESEYVRRGKLCRLRLVTEILTLTLMNMLMCYCMQIPPSVVLFCCVVLNCVSWDPNLPNLDFTWIVFLPIYIF